MTRTFSEAIASADEVLSNPYFGMLLALARFNCEWVACVEDSEAAWPYGDRAWGRCEEVIEPLANLFYPIIANLMDVAAPWDLLRGAPDLESGDEEIV